MAWGPAWMGDTGWFSGVGLRGSTDSPSLLPVSIGGHGYVIETAKYKRSTIEALRPSLDQAPEPGEVSLNTAGLWRRSQSDWRLGAMQLMFDEGDPQIQGGSKRSRYWTSKGINPHPDTPSNAYQMRLHKDVQKSRTSANGNLILVIAGTYCYVVDGAELYWTTALAGGATVWTAAGMSAATGGLTILGACFDGAYVYAAVGVAGLYRTAAGSTVAAKFSAQTHTVNAASYASGHLLCFNGPNLSEISALGQFESDTVGNLGALTVASGVGATTTLTVSPTAFALAPSVAVTLSYGVHSQTFTTSAAPLPAGSTTITILSATPGFNYPIGTQVTGPTVAVTGLLAYTYPNAAYTYLKALSTPHGIFVAANSPAAGEMARLDTNASTGALIPPESMFILPTGEAMNDMCYYSGAVIIATSFGVRVATVVVSFVISCTYGPVILITGGVAAIFGYGQWGWFSWANYDTSSTGMGRLDLARFALDLTPAVSSDIMAGTAAAPVQGSIVSVANYMGVPVFSVSGLGVWNEHPTNYVTTATFDTGRIKFGTTEKKLPIAIDLYHDPLPAGASISVGITDEAGNVSPGSSSATLGSVHPLSMLSINDSAPTEIMSLQFTLNNGTDLTKPPVLRRWTVYVLVTPRRVDRIEVPIKMARSYVAYAGNGDPVDMPMDTLAEWQYLKGLEMSGTPVLYTEGDNSQLVYIDQVMVEATKWSSPDHHWLEGLVTVALVTLEVGQ